MKFTYDGYAGLLDLLTKREYVSTDYFNWDQYDKCVILRHDIDIDLQKAWELAKLEYQLGIKSIYFVLLTSNFYNPYSCRNRKILEEIQNMGHIVGLHFDEMAYPDDVGKVSKIILDIELERKMLSEILGKSVDIFSYHRPTKEILDADIRIQGVINSYNNTFFNQFKYLSDSRMRWREPVLEIIRKESYQRLHILTHPFWYQDNEKNVKEILNTFIKGACLERYGDLNDNFTHLDEIITRGGTRL